MSTKKFKNLKTTATDVQASDSKSSVTIEVIRPIGADDGFEPFPFGTTAEGHKENFEFVVFWTDGQPRSFSGSVDFSTEAQSATSGADYTDSSGTLTIPAGQSRSNVASRAMFICTAPYLVGWANSRWH